MKIDTVAKILTAESKPYDFNGNQGVSHKIRLSVNGEIYVCRSNAEQVASLSKMVGQDGKATIVVESRKENMSLRLEAFTTK